MSPLARDCLSKFKGSESLNRTSVAFEMGARTPLAAMIAAVAVGLIAWVLGPLLVWMPMPVIFGVLALVGIGMITGNDMKALRNLIDGPVFLATVFSVVFLGLETGIFVAMAVSVAFLVASASKVKFAISEYEHGHEHIIVTGNLFFAPIDRLARHLHGDPTVHTVLDISRVSYCDATAQGLISRVQAERIRHGGRLEVARD